ncbi:MFS transporter [Streptomyces sp. NBC_00459]|uniref:MFS transporter n=1 Tax=Streptomyces sp. NBC_00459 TaxID=2975749 RepID=UPI002E174EB2
MATTPETPQTTERNAKLAGQASFIGSMVEYYDFYLYGSAAALVFPRLFFPASDPAMATLASLTTFGAGYVVRPFAAALFGHFGDRISRKSMLVLTLFLMGVASFAVGLLPTYASIGIWAPIALTVLRLLQGASAAGETAGAVSLSLEHAPEGRRAFFASWTPSGMLAGSALATVVFLVFSMLPDDQFMSWGWRIPFMLSACLVITGLVLRARLPEPPTFESAKSAVAEKDQKARLPIVTVLTRYPLAILRVVGLQLYSVLATIGGVFALSYGTLNAGISASTMLSVKLVSTTAAVGVQIVGARYADRFGRKPVFVTGALIDMVAIFLLFGAIGVESVPLVFLGHFLVIAVGYALSNCVAYTMTAEMFDINVRYTGIAVSTQLAQVLTGFAPAIAASLVVAADGGWIWVATACAGACLVSALVVLLGVRETHRTASDQLGRKPVDSGTEPTTPAHAAAELT